MCSLQLPFMVKELKEEEKKAADKNGKNVTPSS